MAVKEKSIPMDKIERTDKEWREMLSEEEYRVMRKAGTEKPFSGEYNMHFEDGIYHCKGCGTALFNHKSKFDGHCGWPSFDQEIEKGIILEKRDTSHGMIRTEIECSKCGTHLGHIFPDGPTASGLRYCVNSISLGFSGEEK